MLSLFVGHGSQNDKLRVIAYSMTLAKEIVSLTKDDLPMQRRLLTHALPKRMGQRHIHSVVSMGGTCRRSWNTMPDDRENRPKLKRPDSII